LKLTVYIDMLILLNGIINYFFLKFSFYISKTKVQPVRIILSAFTGSLFSFFIFIENSWIIPAVKLLSLILPVLICTGRKKAFLKNCIIYIFLNVCFTGFLFFFMSETEFIYINNSFYYININPLYLVAGMVLVFLLITAAELMDSFINRADIRNFTLYFNGERVEVRGFYDTGFRVKDILTGRPVMLCSTSALPSDISRQMADMYYGFCSGNYSGPLKVTPVFYSDISSRGMLPAVQQGRIICENREISDVLLAFTDKPLLVGIRVIFGKDLNNLLEG